MAGLYPKQRFKRYLFSWPALVLLLLPIGLLASATWSAWGKMQNTKDNLAAVAVELEELRERESALAEELERLDTRQGLEGEIRRKFELGKEGEEVIIIVDNDPEPAPVPEKEEAPWWKWWAD